MDIKPTNEYKDPDYKASVDPTSKKLAHGISIQIAEREYVPNPNDKFTFGMEGATSLLPMEETLKGCVNDNESSGISGET